jgi:hypothetical protein
MAAQADTGLTSLQPTRQSDAYGFSLFSVNLRRRRKQSKSSDFSLFFTPKGQSRGSFYMFYYRRRLKSAKIKTPAPKGRVKRGGPVYVP